MLQLVPVNVVPIGLQVKPCVVGACAVMVGQIYGQLSVGVLDIVIVGPGSTLTVIAVVPVQAPLEAVTV